MRRSLARPGDRRLSQLAAGEVLLPANITWDNNQCLSADHGDRYFSADGQAEVQRVFMAPVQFSERAQALRDGSTFTCGELGFGTGLNVATVADAFLAQAPKTARLHLISTERAPLLAADIQRMALLFAAKLPIYTELAAAYPALLSGWHRLHLAEGRVVLSLHFGDAAMALSDIGSRQRVAVDHWLLDGFAPKKNPSLWKPALFEQMAGLSSCGTTVATYTAVGEVRRSLESVGFAMRKVDQMPIKLHSLAGTFEPNGMPAFDAPSHVQVIGAGIAGASAARSLAERGINVRLVETSSRIASHASRIPAAVLHGRLRDDGSPGAAWQALSSHYSHQRLLHQRGYRPTGAQQISGPNAPPERLAAIFERYKASGGWLEQHPNPNSAWRVAESALRFNIGGVVHGPTLCRSLADHPLITLHDSAATRSADHPTILANAIQAQSHPYARYLEIAALAGQAELCAHPAPPTEPIVGAGYLAPCPGGMVIGSTYEYRAWPKAEAIAANLKPWRQHGQHRASFRAYRTITSDRVCIVGKLYAQDLTPIPNLRISTGFGSTGMSSAPLAGECIAAELAGEFAPVTCDIETAISSLRFRERQARRGARMGADPT